MVSQVASYVIVTGRRMHDHLVMDEGYIALPFTTGEWSQR